MVNDSEEIDGTSVPQEWSGAEPGAPEPYSFEARMQARRREREQRNTELFDPPGFQEVFKVEMRVLGYKRLAAIALRYQHVRGDADRHLYIAADQILAATVAIHKIENGALRLAEGLDWSGVASAFSPDLDGISPRDALVGVLDGMGVLALNNDWYEWNTQGNANVDGALSRDFPATT